MPEIPDVEVYLACLRPRVVTHRLEGLRIASPFLLRSVTPPLSEMFGREVTGLRRLGKRIVFELDGDYFLILHLMIAGRLRWEDASGAKIPGRIGLCAFDFDTGTLLLTEAGSKRRASLYAVEGEAELTTHHRGGIEVLDASLEEFTRALVRERHTLKRTLTDQRLFSGIGNAYSDEILFAARLSPLRLGTQLSAEEIERLYLATRSVLREWIDRLSAEAGGGFPKQVTAFREEMMVHGRHRQPCRVCETPVQRIAYAENELNYCPRCQNEGRLLKDRSLSRLLRDDWPKRADELEGAPGLGAKTPPGKR